LLCRKLFVSFHKKLTLVNLLRIWGDFIQNKMDKNLIIFLIAIAWFIYNSYKRNQKKKQQLAARREASGNQEVETEEYYEEEEESQVSQIFEEILMGERSNRFKSPYQEPQPITQKPVAQTQPTYETLEVPVEEIRKSRSKERTENQEITFRSGRSFKSSQSEEEELLGEHLFDDDEFDLRKAVIYAEVLNRPYS
jgi:hypothetical protein